MKLSGSSEEKTTHSRNVLRVILKTEKLQPPICSDNNFINKMKLKTVRNPDYAIRDLVKNM
jgi:hypothetical protein